MSSLAFCAYPIDNINENNQNNENTNKPDKKKLNKTFKRRNTTQTNHQLNNMYNEIHSSVESDKKNNLGDFNPIPPPQSMGGNRIDEKRMERESNENNDSNGSEEKHMNHEYNNYMANSEQYNMANINDNGIQSNVMDEYMSYYNKINKTDNKDDLLAKLSYIINMLEEQQDEKTGHVMEELILYIFLGIFIIFVIDSFARASKYVR